MPERANVSRAIEFPRSQVSIVEHRLARVELRGGQGARGEGKAGREAPVAPR
jgi:hypothetical protein